MTRFRLGILTDLLGVANPRLSSDTTLEGETRSDLVNLLTGHEPADDREALEARWRFAVLAADAVQGQLCLGLDPDAFSEEELNALLQSRSRLSVHPKAWHGPIPFVGIATDYAPWTTQPAPVGDVRLIDPSDETALIDSLAQLDLVLLAERSEQP